LLLNVFKIFPGIKYSFHDLELRTIRLEEGRR
jgi:hypothetical protein